MKQLLTVALLAALAVPGTFAQMPKGGTTTHPQHATTQTTKAVRKTVSLQSLPEATRAAITKAVGSGKVIRLVSVTENGTTSYQATVNTGGKRSMVKFDANGNVM